MTVRQRARPKAASVRDIRILEVARRHFASAGFEGTAIAQVAAEADVAVGTVYLRYETKAALLEAVLLQVGNSFVDVMARASASEETWSARLSAIFTALLKHAYAQPDLPALMGLEVHSMSSNGRDAIKQWIRSFIEAGQQAGAFRDVPSAPAAEIAFGMVDAGMRDMTRSGVPAETMAAILADAATRWMIEH